MKNKFLLAFLCLGLLTSNFSCQKEEALDISDQNKYVVKTISTEEISKNTNLSAKIDDILFKSNEKSSTNNRLEYNEFYDFYIKRDKAIYIEYDSYHSYTFPILRQENNPNKLENLLLSLKNDGSYKALLVSYDITPSERILLQNGGIVDFTDRVEAKNLDYDLLNFNGALARDIEFEGGLFYNTDLDYCYVQDPVIDSATGMLIKWAQRQVQCPWDGSSDPPAEEGDGGTSGGGSNGGSTSNDGSTSSGGTSSDGSTGNGGTSGNGPGGGTNNGNGGNNDNTDTVDPVDCVLVNGECVLDVTHPIDSDDVEIRRLKSIIEAPISPSETEFSYRERISAIGDYFTLTSHIDFEGLKEMLLGILNDPNLSSEDITFAFNKAKMAYNILKPYAFQLVSLDSLDDISVVIPPAQLTIAEDNLTTIAFLPQVKSLIENNWPQTIAQWATLGDILFQPQFLLEIGVGFIPGSSIIDVVSGLNESDYIAVTVGIAGLIVDAFGGTIIKAIGKIGKVAWKSFRIFKIAFRYIDEIADIITLGYKADLVDGVVKLSNTVGTAIAEIENNVIRFLTNGAKSLIKVADLKLLDNVIPSPSGNIGKLAIDEKALKIRPDNSDYADDIADIVNNGDLRGDKTEALMQDLLAQDGFNPPDFDVHLSGNQGFDNVLIKRGSDGSIEDVIINESKQVGAFGNISLSSGVSGCGDCTQMSKDWIEYTIERMNNSGNINLIQLANDIENFGVSNVTQIVSGVNKNTGELVIVNITGYN